MSVPPSDLSDARSLFSPVLRVDREPSTDAPPPADSPMFTSDDSEPFPRPHKAQSCSVEIPRLSSSQKANYRSVAEDLLESDDEFPREGVEQIVGKSREHGNRFYYVLYTDGVVYKVPARSFSKCNPELAQAFDEASVYHPFSPSSEMVHPASRTSLKFTIPAPGSRHVTNAPSSDNMILSDSSSESDTHPRRSGRAAAALANKRLHKRSTLPFSPKKTRSAGRAISIHSSESEDESQDAVGSTRKSTRTRKTRYNLDDDDFEQPTSAHDSEVESNKVIKRKKIVRGKASRPAYGNIRVIADLVYDEEENEDIAPLIAHRNVCEKCHTSPSHEQLAKPKRGRKRKAGSDESDNEETRLANLGGWVRCLKCPVAAHWGCLAKTQRDEILRAAHERDKVAWRDAGSTGREPSKREGLSSYQTTEFICGSCMKGGICMGCKEIALRPDQFVEQTQPAPIDDDTTMDSSATMKTTVNEDMPRELLFRCFTCKRLAHYAHLPVPDGQDHDMTVETARYYQDENEWKCADCASYVYTVEHILAWRPYPVDAAEPVRAPHEPPNHRIMLPREYLVKWIDRSYRRVQWVPHGWLLAVTPGKLKNFLLQGTKVPLLSEPVSDIQVGADGDSANFEIGVEVPDGAETMKIDQDVSLLAAANPEAERKIPPEWRTVDRVLDVLLWYPRKAHNKGKGRQGRINSSGDEDDTDGVDPKFHELREMTYDHGEQPPRSAIVTVEEFESLTKGKLDIRHAGQVAWGFFKWDDLGYDDASWDSPPRGSETGYAAFENAFSRFLFGRSVVVPIRKSKIRLDRGKRRLFSVDKQPELGQDSKFKLMNFQIDGVNWLHHNWSIEQNCILADEMGLGKTVQIVTFIGDVVQTSHAYPILVVVPNSTITNWVREFERWAPKLRVVPFYGEAKSREIIKRYELNHAHRKPETTGAKYHVLVTTYETVTNREFGPVFKSTPRWEMLVVDEGQRLKSDSSLIFKRLKELNTFHRIIMTGTPLNNNIRELFNLMNFLDPDKWHDLDALSKQFEVLNDELVAELHARLKPYFLRRIKSEVLDLPPKNEVIVPLSMAPLQKEIYRSILSQNLDILRSLAEGNAAASSKGRNATSKTNMNNMLMQLRKCLQHPYLVSQDIEPRDLSVRETHERLIGASAKLRLLKIMLPKLRARGHRVLLFSQFIIALDIIEDFLTGEEIKFLRLDGNTKQADRQKHMDEFNKPDADVSIFLLSTRAGGVGINLWSADTVIIFDPDFNPHQDLQAIARAHRYGQKKTVLVFKLMVKDSAEERIMQTGKKKLVLDHLIVQKMDDENGSGEDIQSILLFGAKALFDDNVDSTARDIHYSEHDIENLIEKTEKEGDIVEPESGPSSLFAFAKVWSSDKAGLEELADDMSESNDQGDSWSRALELIAQQNAAEKEKEVTGRGVRRKAAAVFAQAQQSYDFGDNSKEHKGKGKRSKKPKGDADDDADFRIAELADTGSDMSEVDAMDVDVFTDLELLASSVHKDKRKSSQVPLRPLSPARRIAEIEQEYCGLCATPHAPGECSMTESPENLAQFRLMLMQHAGDETIEERRAAIRVIDETLNRLGKTHLIYGQPLQLVEVAPQPPLPQPAKKPRVDTPTHGFYPVPQAQPTRIVQSTAGPSNAASSSPRVIAIGGSTSSIYPYSNLADDAPKTKKVKEGGRQVQSICIVCGQVPSHLIKDCPVVAQGPSSISRAIERLSKDPARSSVVEILTTLKRKMSKNPKTQNGSYQVLDVRGK